MFDKTSATARTLPERLERAHLTPAELSVLETIEGDGLHVIHFWAPWCENSTEELRRGFQQIVRRHPEVTFTFVTVWNDGASGAEYLARVGLRDRVREVVQEDFGPREEKDLRRRVFLGLPVTWIPTTWIFHNNGQLAFAANYGELDADMLEQLIALASREW